MLLQSFYRLGNQGINAKPIAQEYATVVLELIFELNLLVSETMFSIPPHSLFEAFRIIGQECYKEYPCMGGGIITWDNPSETTFQPWDL